MGGSGAMLPTKPTQGHHPALRLARELAEGVARLKSAPTGTTWREVDASQMRESYKGTI